MKILVKFIVLLMVAGVSFTSCSKKLTEQEVQQINTASAETKAEYEELKTVKIEKADKENKIEKEKKKRYKRKEEKKKLRTSLGYAPEEEETTDSTSVAPAATPEEK